MSSTCCLLRARALATCTELGEGNAERLEAWIDDVSEPREEAAWASCTSSTSDTDYKTECLALCAQLGNRLRVWADVDVNSLDQYSAIVRVAASVGRLAHRLSDRNTLEKIRDAAMLLPQARAGKLVELLPDYQLHPVDVLARLFDTCDRLPLVFSPFFLATRIARVCANVLADAPTHSAALRNWSDNVLSALEHVLRLLGENAVPRNETYHFKSLLTSLVYMVGQLELGDERRRRAHLCWSKLIDRLDETASALVIIESIRRLVERRPSHKLEPQLLAFLIDMYRQRLFKSPSPSEPFVSELGVLWSMLEKVHYTRPNEATAYWGAQLVLVRLHAKIGVRRTLLAELARHVVDPMRQQLSDYRQLLQLQQKGEELASTSTANRLNEQSEDEDSGEEEDDGAEGGIGATSAEFQGQQLELLELQITLTLDDLKRAGCSL